MNGGDLDRVYLSRATALSTLNGGKGVSAGYVRISDAAGRTADLDFTSAKTLGDVIDLINASGLNIAARINDTGDGILLEENPDSGTGNDIRVEELYGGTTARDLGILGLGSGGATGLSRLDGSFERRITVLATNTLLDVMNKIGDAKAGVFASIINDGSVSAPYRLVVTAERSGAAGDFVLDTDIASLRLRQGAAGKDALLLYGQPTLGVSPVLLASATNSNNSAVLGMTLNLKKVSSQYTTIAVTRDTQKAAEGVKKLVESYNSLQELVSRLDRYESEEKAEQNRKEDANYIPPVLFGDASLRALMREISDLFFHTVRTSQGTRSLYDAGITFDDKGKLVYDAVKFEDLLANDFETARELFILNRDVARKDLDATASAPPAGSGTDIKNIINGDTSSNNFGPANGYESADNIPAGGLPVTIQFASPRLLSRLAIYHIDSTAMPAAQYALKNFTVEYLNAATGKWETLRNIANNRSAVNYLGFMAPTSVSALRIIGYDTNHPTDKRLRLVEVEAYETQGIAGRMDQTLSRLASSSEGFFAKQEAAVQEKI
ncbi:MAG: flagellar filament capping protein FliD, partial [Planctomycetota bacterium]|nr:flagellar filament capping protein FliD [Planctomycetota bacterium]